MNFFSFYYFLVFLVSSITIIKTACFLLRIFQSIIFIRKKIPVDSRKQRKFIVVLPLLMEQLEAPTLIDYLTKIWGKREELLMIVAVTTVREKAIVEKRKEMVEQLLLQVNSGTCFSDLVDKFGTFFSLQEIQVAHKTGELTPDYKTTLDVINKIQKKVNMKLNRELLVVTEANDTGGNRATQVNHALRFIYEKILKLNYKPQEIFTGIFDADSRPEPCCLDEINSYDEASKAFQMPTLYTSNLGRFKNCKLNDLVMISESLHQTAWCFGHEMPVWRKNVSKSLLSNLPPSYMTGHGEWLRLDLWQEIGGEPEKIAAGGMALGYKLSMMSVPLLPLKSFDLSEVPLLPTQMIKQHKLWFAGGISIWKILTKMDIKNRSIVCWLRLLLICLMETFQKMLWAFSPFIHGICFLFFVLTGVSNDLFFFWLISVIFNLYPPLILIYLFLRKTKSLNNQLGINHFSLTRLPVFSLAIFYHAILKSLGPLWFLLTLPKYGLWNRKNFSKVCR